MLTTADCAKYQHMLLKILFVQVYSWGTRYKLLYKVTIYLKASVVSSQKQQEV